MAAEMDADAELAADPAEDPEASQWIPLDELLSWEDSGAGHRIDLSEPGGDPLAKPESSLRLGIEREEDLLRVGPRRGSRTDIDLSLPVGDEERLLLRGGVRVEGEEGTRGSERRETVPTLGIEKRF